MHSKSGVYIKIIISTEKKTSQFAYIKAPSIKMPSIKVVSIKALPVPVTVKVSSLNAPSLIHHLSKNHIQSSIYE